MAFNLAVLTFYISPFLTEKLKQIPKHPEKKKFKINFTPEMFNSQVMIYIYIV